MWMDLWPVFLAAVAIVYVPGFFVVAPARLTFPLKIAIAPAVSISIFAASAIVVDLVSVRWGVGAVAGGWAVFLLLAILVKVVNGLLFSRSNTSSGAIGRQLWLVSQYLFGMLVTGVVVGRGLLASFHGPETIAQRFDNAFHLNAIAGIIRDGSASPFTVARDMVSGGFYPAGWHEFVALTMQVGGGTLASASHACTLAAIYVVWPLSCMALLETAFRQYAASRILVGSVCASMVAFPYVVLNWGLIYPNLLGFTFVPALIAVIVQMCGIARLRVDINLETGWVLCVVAMGTGFSHPSAVLTAFAFALPALIYAMTWKVGTAAARCSARNRIEAAIIGAVLVATVGGWIALKPSLENAPWAPYETASQALGEFLSGTSTGLSGMSLVSLFSVVGLGLLIGDRGRRWLVGGVGVFAMIFVVGAGAGNGVMRDLVVGVFYGDTRRTGMLAALAGVLLCVYALHRILLAAHGFVRRSGVNGRFSSKVRVSSVLLAVSLVCMIPINLLILRSGAFVFAASGISEAFDGGERADILSNYERLLMEDIARVVPADAVIINNSWDGSGLIYAYTGIEVMDLYMFEGSDADEDLLRERLRYAASDPAVCEVVSRRNARYFAKFGTWAIAANSRALEFPGFQDVGDAPGFTLVAQRGDASLYRIDACD